MSKAKRPTKKRNRPKPKPKTWVEHESYPEPAPLPPANGDDVDVGWERPTPLAGSTPPVHSSGGSNLVFDPPTEDVETALGKRLDADPTFVANQKETLSQRVKETAETEQLAHNLYYQRLEQLKLARVRMALATNARMRAEAAAELFQAAQPD